MTGFVKERRYVVLKLSDLGVLTAEERRALAALEEKVEAGRRAAGKEDLEAVVVERDWSCYQEVWELVEEEAKK